MENYFKLSNSVGKDMITSLPADVQPDVFLGSSQQADAPFQILENFLSASQTGQKMRLWSYIRVERKNWWSPKWSNIETKNSAAQFLKAFSWQRQAPSAIASWRESPRFSTVEPWSPTCSRCCKPQFSKSCAQTGSNKSGASTALGFIEQVAMDSTSFDSSFCVAPEKRLDVP